jgi:chromosome segregation ATPase
MQNFNMRPSLFIFVATLMAALSYGQVVRAESETDRLREALRSAIAQTRTLEDQQAAAQARQAESDRERDRLKHEIDAAKARTQAVEKAHAEAVEEFNRRLEERNDVLEKWKAAYEEAASVARDKDAERAKFETESKTFKASAKSCATRNIKLVAVGNDLLERLEAVELGDVLAAHEPLIGFKRVEIQNLLRDYQDKILEQRANP